MVSPASIHDLIELRGPPPKEVCLDWALQLIEFSSVVSAEKSETTPMGWQHWMISASGRLEYTGLAFSRPGNSEPGNREPDDHSVPNTNPLVVQLLDWAGAQWPAKADRQDPKTQIRLIEDLTETLQLKPSRQSIVHPHSASGEKVLDERQSPATFVIKPMNFKSDALPIRSLAARKKTIRPKVRRRIRTTATLLAVGLMCVGVLFWLLREPNQLVFGEKSSMQKGGVATATVRSDKHKGDNLDSREVVIGPELAEPSLVAPTAAQNESLSQDQAASLVLLDDFSFPDDSQLLAEEPTAQQNAGVVSNTLSVTGIAGGLAVNSHGAPSAGNAPDLETYSVSAVLEEVVPSEEIVCSIEGEMVTSDSSSYVLVPPQLLRCDTFNQVMSFPGTTTSRSARWQLSLDATEQLLVEPSSVQELNGRNTISWTLTPKVTQRSNPAQSPRIIVQAKLSGRSADIRWNVSVIREDAPVSLTLDPKYLEATQTVLLQHQELLRTSIDVIKAQSGQSGLTREQRATLTTRRRFLEEQFAAADKALQLHADAVIVASQLRDGLPIRGTLLDQNNSANGKILLKMGHPQTP